MRLIGKASLLLAVTAALTGTLRAWELGPVDVHGTFSQGYMDSTQNHYIEDSLDGTADFREYGINGMWHPLDKLSIGAQIFAREYGSVGNDDPYVDWALLDYRHVDWLGIKVGRMKVPYGLYNETRDVDALRTEILLPQGVYMEYQRELLNANDGVCLYGDVGLGDAGSVTFSAQYGTRVMEEDNGDMARILGGAGIELEDIETKEGYALGLEWQTPLEGLRVAATYSLTGYDADAIVSPPGAGISAPALLDVDDQVNAAASLEYTVGNLVLAAEYGQTSFESVTTPTGPPIVTGMPMGAGGPPPGAATPAAAMGTSTANGAVVRDSDYEGWYFRAGYRFTDWLEAAAGFTMAEGPEIQATGPATKDNDQEDIYISVRVDVTEYLIIKLENHVIHGGLGVFHHENNGVVENDMNLFIAKGSLYF